jgi:hypothetical protein
MGYDRSVRRPHLLIDDDRWAWHTGRTLRRGLMRREDF